MKHLTFCALLALGFQSVGMAQYPLSVESYPAVQEGLTTYRFYVNMQDPTDRMSAVYGNNDAPFDCDGGSIEFCANVTCGADSISGSQNVWDWSATPDCVISQSDNQSICYVIDAVYNGDIGDESEEQSKDITLTDSYGCSASATFDFVVFENPTVNIEGEYVCADDSLNLFVSGADTYDWDVSFNDQTVVLQTAYWLNYAATGDSIEEIHFTDPTQCSGVTATGHLFYELGDSALVCSSEDFYNCIVFDVPVIEPSILPNAPYCEDSDALFEDLNGDSNPVNTTYDYLTSSGIDIQGTADNSLQFPLITPGTTLEVTKVEINLIQGTGTACTATWDTTLTVYENPFISLDYDSGICQDDSAQVTCILNNPDNNLTYTHTWGVSDNGVLFENGSQENVLVHPINWQDTQSPENLVVDCVVESSAGCVSNSVQVDIEVGATPILDILDGLVEENCSPFADCLQVGLLNEDLDPNLGISYFWNNEAGVSSSTYCSNFTNPTQCPLTDSISVIVRFAHTLSSGDNLFCVNDTVDHVVVNPTPIPAFSLEVPQACLDTANGNCVPVLHDVSEYDVCEGDLLSYEWFVTPLGELIQNDIELNNLTTPYPSICLDTAGTVNIVLEITNQFGCSQTTSNVPFVVRGLSVPELTFSQPSICLPTTVSVLNTSSGASDFSLSSRISDL